MIVLPVLKSCIWVSGATSDGLSAGAKGIRIVGPSRAAIDRRHADREDGWTAVTRPGTYPSLFDES